MLAMVFVVCVYKSKILPCAVLLVTRARSSMTYFLLFGQTKCVTQQASQLIDFLQFGI